MTVVALCAPFSIKDDIVLTALPVLLSVIFVLGLGQVLSRTILKEASFWQGISKLSYWVLFPALLFKTVALSDFTGMQVNATLVTMLVGLFGITLITWFLGSRAQLASADLSSVLQGAFRHNGFMALAIIAGLYGQDGVELGTLCLAALVPPSNVMSVIILIWLNKRDKQTHLTTLLIKEIGRNPLILAILAGLVAKFAPFELPYVIYETSELLGRGALPALLLAVGASVHFTSAVRQDMTSLALALLAKVALFPALLVSTAIAFGISGMALEIIVIFGVMPTAVSAYALAKELGGNAELMAEIISFQTIISLPAMLLWLSFLR